MTARQWKIKLFKELEIGEQNLNFFNIKVFTDVPDVLRVSQDDEGRKLWLADEPKTKTVRLKRYNRNSLNISYAGEKKHRSCYKQEAVIHPDEVTKERLEKFNYKIKDGRKS